ncbi:MAG: hypothetical protein GHCLOJNM_01085 [bacterium]|nr:hypothetical protein [bacterium]
MRVVVDTNVIISGLFQPEGIPGTIRKLIGKRTFDLCLSRPLIEEISEVLDRPSIRPRLKVQDWEVEEFLQLLSRLEGGMASPRPIDPTVLADPDDDMILATALAAKADVIVSGDRHLLDLQSYQGIPILSPRQFLDRVELGESGKGT